jgi:hypothetical protein
MLPLRDGELHDRRRGPNEIYEVRHFGSLVEITLNNGVSFSVSSNPQSLHISFCYADHVTAAPQSANTVGINYQPYEGVKV